MFRFFELLLRNFCASNIDLRNSSIELGKMNWVWVQAEFKFGSGYQGSEVTVAAKEVRAESGTISEGSARKFRRWSRRGQLSGHTNYKYQGATMNFV